MGVNLHLFLNSPGMSLEPCSVSGLRCCEQVSFVKRTKTKKVEDTIQLLETLLRKLSTAVGHKILGLESTEMMA